MSCDPVVSAEHRDIRLIRVLSSVVLHTGRLQQVYFYWRTAYVSDGGSVYCALLLGTVVCVFAMRGRTQYGVQNSCTWYWSTTVQ